LGVDVWKGNGFRRRSAGVTEYLPRRCEYLPRRCKWGNRDECGNSVALLIAGFERIACEESYIIIIIIINI